MSIAWSTESLVTLLSSSAPDDERTVLRLLERVAGLTSAHGFGVIAGQEISSRHGLLDDPGLDDRLLAAVQRGAAVVELRDGLVVAVHALLVDPVATRIIVFVRSEPFERAETDLLDTVGQLVSVLFRQQRSLDVEQSAREATEALAAQTARLVASLRDRQRLFDRLASVERAISQRRATNEVLDAITAGVSELLGDDVVTVLRLIDEADPKYTRLVSIAGLEAVERSTQFRVPTEHGVGALAMAKADLAVANAVDFADIGQDVTTRRPLMSGMAVPVYRETQIAGCLAVVSRRERSSYSLEDEETLRAFAEHVTIALNDASAVQSMRQALDTAVYQASHDGLTGLANRSAVLSRLDHELRRLRSDGGRLAVLFIDVDRFKPINDALGHQFGDAVLRTIAKRLNGAVRSDDLVGRLSGDEFVVVCPGLDELGAVERAHELQRVVNVPIRGLGRVQQVSVSIGVASAIASDKPEGLVANADIAMYRSKEQGRGRVVLFDEQFRLLVRERKFLADELASSVTKGELALLFQPSFRLLDGRLGTSEALVRWHHPRRGLVMPDQFMGLAEETGAVRAIDMWVLEDACRHLGGWPHRPGSLPEISINMSARQFADPLFVDRVAEILDRAEADPTRLWLEVTERVLLEDSGQTRRSLDALGNLGIRLAVDDFGVGYSSLGYLHRFPLHAIKIDRSFVGPLGTDARADAVVQAMLHMSAALGLHVVAEGVEREDQMERLFDLDEGRLGPSLYCQGFLLGRPQDAATIHDDALLAQVHRRGDAPSGPTNF